MPVLLLKFLLFYGENRLIMPDNQKKNRETEHKQLEKN